MSEWKPAITTYIETATQDKKIYEVKATIYCDEPLNIAVCRRVEREPITAAALRREGWKDAEEDECVLVKRIDDNLTCYFWNDLEGKEHFEVVYAAITYPGVHTVQDLLTLARFLEGTTP